MECFLNGSILNDVGIVSILLRRLESGIRWTVIKNTCFYRCNDTILECQTCREEKFYLQCTFQPPHPENHKWVSVINAWADGSVSPSFIGTGGEALQPVQPNPELNRSAASTEAALRVKVRIVRGNSAEGLWVEEK